MLPSLVAREIKDGLEHFLRSAFPVTTPGFWRFSFLARANYQNGEASFAETDTEADAGAGCWK